MHDADVLGQLRSEWRWVSVGPRARAVVRRLRAEDHSPVPDDVHDLDGLVLALEPRGGLDEVRRARIVAVLLAAADDPLVRRCLLQTLLPGIVSVARQLQFGAGVADDPRTFLAEALAEAVELLSSWSGQRRRYAAGDLLNALRCRLRRRMLADKRRRTALVGDERRPEAAGADEDELVRALVRAVDDGVTDVDLLYARCVLGCSANALAAARGISTAALHRRLAAAAAPFVASPS